MNIVKVLSISSGVLLLSACSVFGDSGVESAPYTLLVEDKAAQIEVRNYESMVLVSANMQGDGRNSAFRKLFKYITGANEGEREIAMTAPVFIDQDNAAQNSEGAEIAMTAPVFMNENTNEPSMSFVMPASFTIDTTPIPTDPEITVSEITDYKVVAIKFSGTLGDANVDEHTRLLVNWAKDKGYNLKSEPVLAGYNGPLTLPMYRRNEVLIEIQ
ncbi:SOUL family heme-binding protein [Ningiella sp. W23]|uniref:SOUL family heme-binding protein n=1 Tax=Ningiella sp. W23 TaxID=3023715 RepID=UPI0037574F8C